MAEQVLATPRLVRQAVEARVRAEQLAAAAGAATAEALDAVDSGLELLVGAEQRQEDAAGLLAHAVFDIGRLTGTHGLTLCGLMAGEEAVLVHNMFWREVDDDRRCTECSTTAPARR